MKKQKSLVIINKILKNSYFDTNCLKGDKNAISKKSHKDL